MAVETAKLLNEEGLSSLLEGEDAHATQAFFEDYLCRYSSEEFTNDSDDDPMLYIESENLEKLENQKEKNTEECSDDEDNIEVVVDPVTLLLDHFSMEQTRDEREPLFPWNQSFEASSLDLSTVDRGIKKLQHFRFDYWHPGLVFVKTKCDAQEKSHNILKDDHHFSSSSLPPLINPPGLPAERQQYLYDKIREFCPEEVRDAVCPLPSGSLGTQSDSEEEPLSPPPPPPKRKK